MIELNEEERVIWKKSANLKLKYKKIPGKLLITNKKISFNPFLAKKSISINISEIENIELIKGIFKKFRVQANGKNYVFSIKNAEHIVCLVQSLIK